jgi:long-subunit acyl-CoA synthetase (AMP-forming)
MKAFVAPGLRVRAVDSALTLSPESCGTKPNALVEGRRADVFPRNLPGDLVRIAAQRDPSAIAIEHDHGQLTYAQVWSRSVRLANAMLARGLRAGDRVALFAQNCPEYLESYLGLQLAGLVAVPGN